jgi:hypothetical protein
MASCAAATVLVGSRPAVDTKCRASGRRTGLGLRRHGPENLSCSVQVDAAAGAVPSSDGVRVPAAYSWCLPAGFGVGRGDAVAEERGRGAGHRRAALRLAARGALLAEHVAAQDGRAGAEEGHPREPRHEGHTGNRFACSSESA